ncbi:MAG: flagellin [Gemmatimonadota bacterium]|nr:flagellin [Gemmatimonadota bacterium]
MPAINTNSAAMNTQRILGQHSRAFAQSVGRLSSGFRINRAGDDAAGLGIANRLSADVRGLKQAARNAEQGISMLQVAEGGTQQIQAMLERMKELASQAASANSGSRTVLNQEFDALRSEIGRITDSTAFQGNKLLNGSFGNAIDLGNSTLDANTALQTSSISAQGAAAGTYTVTKVDATTLQISDGTNSQNVTVASTGVQNVSFSQFGVSFSTGLGFDISGNNNSFSANNSLVVSAGTGGSFLVSSSGAYTSTDLVSVGQIDLGTGATGLNIATNDLTTQANAQTALTALDGAIDSVSSALADIGTAMNRIDFARTNAEVTIENYAAAEGVIRDADIAAETTNFAKLGIQQQAATAMLAQANAAPQLLLSLLG